MTTTTSMPPEVFDRIYADVSTAKRERLRQFRAAHPRKYLTIDGVDWEYIAAGQGKETLLLMSGGISTAESSFERILKMESSYRVISASYPAVGKMDRLCDGLTAILDAEGIAKTHVLGHSLGAGIAHTFVRLHPERVDKLMLSGFGLYNPVSSRQVRRFLFLFRLLPYGFVSGYYKKAMARLVKDAPDKDEASFMAAYAIDLLDWQHNKKTLVGQFVLLEDVFLHSERYRLREPVEMGERVLILQAKDDTGFKPDEQAALRETYPGAVVHLFENGGHLAAITKREEYEQAIESFLQKG